MRSIRLSRVMPALLTRISTLPNFSRIAFAPASIDSWLDTFTVNAVASIPCGLQLGHRLGQLGLIHVGQRQHRACRGQLLGNRAPNPLRPARHQRNSSLQISHVFC